MPPTAPAACRRCYATAARKRSPPVGAVLDELERSIRGALGETEHWEQGSLFEIDDERDQLRADHEALLARLDALPDQRHDETAALRRHYADPTARWFPAAVEFLVPAAIARAGR